MGTSLNSRSRGSSTTRWRRSTRERGRPDPFPVLKLRPKRAGLPGIGTMVTSAALAALPFFLAPGAAAAGEAKAYERPEYLAIKKQLVRGWGTWDTRDALSQVLLPDSLSVALSFKRATGTDTYSRPRMVIGDKASKLRAS